MGTVLAKADYENNAKAMFEKAEKAAHAIRYSHNHRFKALNQLGAALAKADFQNRAKAVFEEAEKVANDIESDDSINRTIALIELSAELRKSRL